MTKTKELLAEVVHQARAAAVEDGSGAIEAEHILLALSGLAGTPAARLLAGAGLSPEQLRAALDREWEQSLAVAGVEVSIAELPKATPDRHRHPRPGETMKVLLKRATVISAATGGGRLDPTHLLVGALDAPLGRIARALSVVGVDREALRAQAYQEAAGA